MTVSIGDHLVVNSNRSTNPLYGFLTILEIQSLGFCGGLLIVSSKGRPMEFHCTAPTVANQAQQILYGQTLRPFLFCDQIGMALIEKAKSDLAIVVTTNPEILGLTDIISKPVVLLRDREIPQPEESGNPLNVQRAIPGQAFEIDTTKMTIAAHQGGHVEYAEELIRGFLETLPLAEPFERIHQAIQAAQKTAA